MRPSGVHLFVLVNTSFRKTQVRFLDVRKGSEDVLLNHGHDLFNVGDDELGNILLVRKHLLELLDGIKAFSL